MALRQFYENQAEVPPTLAEHYVEKEGRWTLVTDPPTEDVTGLKTALTTERTLRRDAEKTVTDLKVKFEGVDPDEYHKLQERVKGLDDADVYDKQGIEALVTRRTDAMKQDHERQIQSKDREIAQLRTQATDYDRRWRHDRIKTALLEAVNKSGVYDKAIEDAVQYGCGVFTDLDEDGLPVAKKDGINALPPDEWIGTVKASGAKPHWWLPSSGGGAPAQHGGNGAGIDWSKLPPAERMTKFREWQSTGRS
jgi:hypothetical protein